MKMNRLDDWTGWKCSDAKWLRKIFELRNNKQLLRFRNIFWLRCLQTQHTVFMWKWLIQLCDDNDKYLLDYVTDNWYNQWIITFEKQLGIFMLSLPTKSRNFSLCCPKKNTLEYFNTMKWWWNFCVNIENTPNYLP